MPPNDALSTAATAITSGVGKLSGLLNLAAGPTALIGFAAEGIFKAIKLGTQIRAAQRAANAKLDATIRAMDVLQSPINVDLSALKLKSFYDNEDNLDPFRGFRQFEAEIQDFRDNGIASVPTTRRILTAAKEIVPILHIDPTLTDHPELANIFSIGLDPTRRTARELVMAYLQLFPNGKLAYQDQYNRLGDFWKNQLTIALGEIDQSVVNAQEELNATIRNLVTNAIFDSNGGLLTSTLDLAKKLKRSDIEQRIEQLTQQKATAADAEKSKLQKQIDQLTAWKTRIA